MTPGDSLVVQQSAEAATTQYGTSAGSLSIKVHKLPNYNESATDSYSVVILGTNILRAKYSLERTAIVSRVVAQR